MVKSQLVHYVIIAGTVVIDPETAPTVCRGKGLVKDAVFAETKKAICRIKSP